MFSMVMGYLAVVCPSCKKTDEPLPNLAFSGSIYLNDPLFASTSFTVKYDTNHNKLGINGVVVYRFSPNEYYVFDLMCPHDVNIECSVGINNDVTCKCSCCGSSFLIAGDNAPVVEGPSKWGLKPYKSQVNGDYLSIWN